MTKITAKALPDREKREPIPADMYPATCYAVIDIGTHEYVYLGVVRKVRKVVIIFEVPDVRIDIEKDEKIVNLPRVINIEENISLGKKSNLRPVLENWRGRAFTQEELEGFNLVNLLGVPGMLNITHSVNKSGEVYAKISNINPLPRSIEKPKQETPSVVFSFEDNLDWPIDFPEGIPQWVLKKIKESEEYRALEMDQTEVPVEASQNAETSDILEDDCPF